MFFVLSESIAYPAPARYIQLKQTALFESAAATSLATLVLPFAGGRTTLHYKNSSKVLDTIHLYSLPLNQFNVESGLDMCNHAVMSIAQQIAMQAQEVKVLKKYSIYVVNKLGCLQAKLNRVFTLLFSLGSKTLDSRSAIRVVFTLLFTVIGLASCGGGIESYTPTGSTVQIFEVQLTPSRLSGVAPLSVFFDSTNTTHTRVTSRPFHDLEYRWDFGDTAGSPVNGTTWGTGSQLTPTCNAPYNGCRNNATGAVAAHVYETAGTYTVTLNVLSGTGAKTKTTTITVTDPATLTTACVANGALPVAGVDGCPTTSTLFYNQGSFNTALSTAIAAGARRILFRKGNTFTSSASYRVSATGPGIIGAYGSGSSANISMSVIAQYASILNFNNSDWRVMDLSFDGTGTADHFAIVNSITANQLTVLRVTVTRLNIIVNMANADQLAVVDSNFSIGGSGSTGSNTGVYCATCTNAILLGNSMFLNTINSHNIRLQGVTKFVVANSTQTGSERIEPITIRGNTQFGVLSDNKFVDNIVTVRPQNTTSNEFQRDIIFERNWFVNGIFSGPSLQVEGSGVTIRNNIFNLSAGGYTAISTVYISTVSAPRPDLINIYNNTIYNSATHNGNLSAYRATTHGGVLNPGCRSSVQNNLAYSPNTFNLAPVLLSGSSCVITGSAGTSGNSSDSQIRNTAPSFAIATPSNPADFIIGTGSYAHNTGVTLPVFSDFFRRDTLTGGLSSSGATIAP